ncbi:MAG: 2-oxoacid:acceptor oxidoreductase subunit alpha [Desulfobacteraceae bacterium]|nr:2-oxoacid:acceptor oxidoreductase subunit alpha [Desulfobacteraceae bacterium]
MSKVERKVRLIQGNEAIAAGAVYAGAGFYAGYPITPSSEIMNDAARLMPRVGGIFVQMEDEIGSIAAVVGASLGGAKAFTATSGPGFSLMQENLGVAVMGEVPCVLINVQRSGPSTGLATKPGQADIMQVRWGRHGDQTIIALCPGSVPECFLLTVKAFNLSEKFRVPVVLVTDEVIAHARQNFAIPEPGEIPLVERKSPAGPPEKYRPFDAEEDGVAPLAAYGGEYVFHISSSMHGPDGYSNNNPDNAIWRIKQLHEKIEMHRDEIVMTNTYDTDDMDVLLVACGATTGASRAAALEARRNGIRAGVLHLVTIWPFPDREVKELAGRVKKVVVPEMNYAGQVAGEVQKVIGPDTELTRVNKYNGQIITPRDILEVL